MKSRDEIYQFVMEVGSNSLSVFGGAFEGGYQLQQNPPEITDLIYALQSRRFDNFLEIGVAAAGMTRILCDLLDIGNVHTMDLGVHDSVPLAYENNVANLKNDGYYKAFRGDSHSADALRFLQNLGVAFDFAFIDGDHSYEGVKADTILALPFIKKGGVVAFHDQACVPDITRWADELKAGRLGRLSLGGEYVGDAQHKGIIWFEVH